MVVALLRDAWVYCFMVWHSTAFTKPHSTAHIGADTVKDLTDVLGVLQAVNTPYPPNVGTG